MIDKWVNKTTKLRLGLGALLCLVCNGIVSGQAADALPIAGFAPNQRPANAPRLTKEAPLDRQRALFGVSAPVPKSIENFLRHQGEWFNPFLHPGMTGPYDLRGWHKKAKHGKQQ